MRKLPNGISNYEEIVNENRIYVDKTEYIKKLENLEDKTIMFLRPRKFGKTLFTSVLENYYDILKANKFEKLFGNTYIGKNPTPNKNKYHILRFNFSGIATGTEKETIEAFKEKVTLGIQRFLNDYKIDFYINKEQTAEAMLGSIFEAFRAQKVGEKIYVIIDEYDHFANELLGFETEKFKSLVSKNGKIRKWYEILKEGTESVVERIFITGVAPITLDSTTSGFNIARDITKDLEFNDMLGFCEKDVVYLMDELQISKEKQKELLPIIKESYDGYIFSDLIEEVKDSNKIYNSNMTLYFLSRYNQYGKIPKTLTDTNIISDYRKIEGFMDLCNDMGKIDLLQKIVEGETVESELTEKFNSEVSFGEKELISLLFYLGYLTIKNTELGIIQFGSPNEVIRKVYSEYFLNYTKRRAGIIEELNVGELTRQILLQGKIDELIATLKKYLTGLSNRDYERFDEKYVKVIVYSICKMLEVIIVKSELEVESKYSDLLLIPKEKLDERYGILIEFKYIKKEGYTEKSLKKKQKEARDQLEKYIKTEEIKMIPKLRSYSVVAVKDELFVEEIEES